MSLLPFLLLASVLQAQEASTEAVHEEPKPRRVSKVKVHAAAAGWEPLSVKLGGDPEQARTFFKKGPAKAAARVYPSGEDKLLIVSIYPPALRVSRTHLEVRFLIIEGFLEQAKAAAVRIVGGRYTPSDEEQDSKTLERKGVEYAEEYPGSGRILLASIDPGPGVQAVNAGTLTRASFGARDLGPVSLGWSVAGVNRKGAKAAAAQAAGRGKPFLGRAGYMLELPAGYKALPSAEMVYFVPEDVAPGDISDERYAELGIVRLEVTPRRQAGQSLDAYRESLSGRGQTEELTLALPAFLVRVAGPAPYVQAAVEGRRNMFLFTSAKDDKRLRALLKSLREVAAH